MLLFPKNKRPAAPAFAPGIPKALHQIWLGPAPIPAHERAWMGGLKDLHPEWSYRLWGESDVPGLFASALPGVDLAALKIGYDKALNYGFQSDILRILILALFGGLYADCDVECLKPFGPLCDGTDAWIGQTFVAQTFGHIDVENALLASCPRHPFFLRSLSAMARDAPSWSPHPGDFLYTVDKTGPGLLTAQLQSWKAERSAFPLRSQGPDVAIIPARFLFDHSPQEVAGKAASAPHPDAFAFHRFDCTWWDTGAEGAAYGLMS